MVIIKSELRIKRSVICLLSVSYSVNNQAIKEDDLKKIQINKRDYIDYVESIKKEMLQDEKVAS